MFGIEIIEVVLGLIFIYLLLSLLATTLSELAMHWLYSRGKNLRVALRTMLDDETTVLSERFFDHALVRKLTQRGSQRFPSYLSYDYFATVLTELLCGQQPLSAEAIEEGVRQLPAGHTREVLSTFVREAQGNPDQFRQSLEAWYQEMTYLAAGWYKRRVQWVLFGLGVLISVAFNADTFQIARKLSVDPEARREIIEQAYVFMERESDPSLTDTLSTTRSDSLAQRVRRLIDEELAMASTTLGLGWEPAPPMRLSSSAGWRYVGQRVPGWIITALAITLGASFWFDLLKRVMNIRTATRKPEERRKKS